MSVIDRSIDPLRLPASYISLRPPLSPPPPPPALARPSFVFNPPDETARACWISQLSKGQTGQTGGNESFKKAAAPAPSSLSRQQPAAAARTSGAAPPAAAPRETPGGGKKWGGIRTTLNKYLSKRPAKEDLKRSGILNEVVFGGSIEEQIASESTVALISRWTCPLVVVVVGLLSLRPASAEPPLQCVPPALLPTPHCACCQGGDRDFVARASFAVRLSIHLLSCVARSSSGGAARPAEVLSGVPQVVRKVR